MLWNNINDVNIAVLGGGIVGMHIAALLQKIGYSVFLLEKEKFLGHHTSSRNSGVIHAGIFYQPKSLKEIFCVSGNKLTYEFASSLGVKTKKTGKLVICNSDQFEDLLILQKKCETLNISNSLLKRNEINKLEPNISSDHALLVDDTGIIDVSQYLYLFEQYLTDNDVTIVKNCDIQEIQHNNRLITNRGHATYDFIINACGLFADDIVKMRGFNTLEIRPMRGDYGVINSELVNMPIYGLPCKKENVLGIHLTPTFDGNTMIGPNGFYIDKKDDYSHKTKLKDFLDSAQKHIYNMDMLKMCYGYSGNRPKLFVDNERYDDFYIFQENCWVHLLGIESPGLTAAPAIAKYVAKMIRGTNE